MDYSGSRRWLFDGDFVGFLVAMTGLSDGVFVGVCVRITDG